MLKPTRKWVLIWTGTCLGIPIDNVVKSYPPALWLSDGLEFCFTARLLLLFKKEKFLGNVYIPGNKSKSYFYLFIYKITYHTDNNANNFAIHISFFLFLRARSLSQRSEESARLCDGSWCIWHAACWSLWGLLAASYTMCYFSCFLLH